MEEMKNVYMAAWKRGLKTTYYLHMKPRHTAEQSTTSVNKGAALGKRGFGSVVASPVSVEAPTLSPIQQSPVHVPEMVPVRAEVQPVVDAVAAPVVASPSRGFGAVAAQSALPTMPAMQQELPTVAAASAPVMAQAAAPVGALPKMGFAVAAAGPAVMATAPAPTSIPLNVAVTTPSVAEEEGTIIQKKKAFVCPVDPAERAQCDSCQ